MMKMIKEPSGEKLEELGGSEVLVKSFGVILENANVKLKRQNQSAVTFKMAKTGAKDFQKDPRIKHLYGKICKWSGNDNKVQPRSALQDDCYTAAARIVHLEHAGMPSEVKSVLLEFATKMCHKDNLALR